jgi:hypothetical protein
MIAAVLPRNSGIPGIPGIPEFTAKNEVKLLY